MGFSSSPSSPPAVVFSLLFSLVSVLSALLLLAFAHSLRLSLYLLRRPWPPVGFLPNGLGFGKKIVIEKCFRKIISHKNIRGYYDLFDGIY